MRITGGEKLRHTLKAPSGLATRPTSDKVRQALFNILMHHDFGAGIGNPIAGAHILDAFCGTGALSFEALSRGGASATLLDKDRNALTTAAANSASLGYAELCALRQADATKPPPATHPCNLIFLDPPYHKQLVPKALIALTAHNWLASNALIVIETAKNEPLELTELCTPLFTRSWGDTNISFATKNPLL